MVLYIHIREGIHINNFIRCNLVVYYEVIEPLPSYRTQLHCMAPPGMDVTSNQVRAYEESTVKEVITNGTNQG